MRKVFIITGTRKGIGKQLAKYYIEKGHAVIGCSRGDSDIEANNYSHHRVDVSNEADVIKLVRKAKRDHGRIDVLLNNAGVASMNHILTTPGKTVRKIFDTNFTGTFLFSREAAKVMMRQKSGRIVNFSTVAVPLRLAGEAIYAASKAAIESFTQVAAYEFGGFGVTINAVGPTPLQTDLIKNVPKDKLQSLLSRQAIHRYGEFEDVVNVIDFFIDDRSNFVTGQTVYLGGVEG